MLVLVKLRRLIVLILLMLLLLLVHAVNNDLFIDAADAVNDYFNAVAADGDASAPATDKEASADGGCC